MSTLVHNSCANTLAVAIPATTRGRILYIIDRLNHTMGGAEGALSKLVRMMPTRGYECSVVCFSAGEEIQQSFACPVTVLPLESLFSAAAFRHVVWLARYIARNNVDVVHTFFPASDILGALAARSCGRLVVCSRRDMGILISNKRRVAYRIVNRLVDQVQAVSDKVRDYCIYDERFSASKVLTIHNGIDLDSVDRTAAYPSRTAFGIPDGVPLVVTVANVRAVKGIDVFVRAAAIVRERIPDCMFLIVGVHQEEDCAHEIFRLIGELNLEHNVFAPGLRDDVIRILKSADVFCLPSRSEGLSNALLEAMACGLPCVATAVGGNPEVIADGVSGFLVPSEQPDLIADRLVAVLTHAELAAQLGSAGRHTVETQFTAHAMADGFAQMYDSLLRG
jgi:glycosyltransferase involved in cell wall biosynthesis